MARGVDVFDHATRPRNTYDWTNRVYRGFPPYKGVCVGERKKEEKRRMGGPFISLRRVRAALCRTCYSYYKFIFCLKDSGYESAVMISIITVITSIIAGNVVKSAWRDKLFNTTRRNVSANSAREHRIDFYSFYVEIFFPMRACV